MVIQRAGDVLAGAALRAEVALVDAAFGIRGARFTVPAAVSATLSVAHPGAALVVGGTGVAVGEAAAPRGLAIAEAAATQWARIIRSAALRRTIAVGAERTTTAIPGIGVGAGVTGAGSVAK